VRKGAVRPPLFIGTCIHRYLYLSPTPPPLRLYLRRHCSARTLGRPSGEVACTSTRPPPPLPAGSCAGARLTDARRDRALPFASVGRSRRFHAGPGRNRVADRVPRPARRALAAPPRPWPPVAGQTRRRHRHRGAGSGPPAASGGDAVTKTPNRADSGRDIRDHHRYTIKTQTGGYGGSRHGRVAQ
jgi:hypothetical protein